MKTERKSKKREKILEIFKKGGLMTANDVIERLPDIDQATIYRNINKFVEKGTLKEIKINRGISSYEYHSKDEHQHFICNDCDKILHVDIDPSKLQNLVKSSGVEAQEFELNIRGKCKDCK